MSKKTVFIISTLTAAAIFSAVLLWRYVYPKDTLYYAGPITLEFLAQVETFPQDKLKHIVIDSLGGEYSIALDVANIIQTNDTQINVDGYCISACASIILPAGKNNIVKKGSLVAFHNLPGLWFYLDKFTKAEYQLSLENDPVYSDSKLTVDLYKKAHINPDIFVALALGKGVVCLGVDKEAPAGRSRTFVRFSSDLYIPNKHIFDQFGWKFEELHLPTDEAEVEKLIAKLRPANPELSYKLEAESFKFPGLFFMGNLGFTHFADCGDEAA